MPAYYSRLLRMTGGWGIIACGTNTLTLERTRFVSCHIPRLLKIERLGKRGHSVGY